jgi:hypothetical protein
MSIQNHDSINVAGNIVTTGTINIGTVAQEGNESIKFLMHGTGNNVTYYDNNDFWYWLDNKLNRTFRFNSNSLSNISSLDCTNIFVTTLTQGYYPYQTASGNLSNGTIYNSGYANYYNGIGTTAPENPLHINIHDAGTNTIVRPLHISHTTSATAATGMGCGIELSSESIYGDFTRMAAIDAYHTVPGGNYSSNLSIKVSDGAGTLTEYLKIETDGGIFMSSLPSASASTDVNINASNELHRVSSSIRYKENIDTFDLDSGKIHNIKLQSFTWRSDVDGVEDGSRGKRDYGIIAEQAAEEMPWLATYNSDGQIESWSSNRMVILLLSEIQKLRKEIDKLKSKCV